ncbi:MAG: class I SAM-dependent RNA methyltransferase [Gemmatimonadales bacterium]
MDVRECYVVTAPGLEEVTAGELAALGLAPAGGEPGGVTFHADPTGLWKANLHLRTASRVVMRFGEFRATAFYELEKRAKKLPWASLVAPGSTVTFRVTSRKSKLYHGKAVAERLGEAVVGAVPGVRVVKSSVVVEDGEVGEVAEVEGDAILPPQLFVVRLFHDLCTISIDSSGELLHRRGYRQAVGRAPLRETLAAAMLLGSRWDGQAPLLDPMCGSGTIPIEAALLARRVPPGWRRQFAFQRWPGFEEARWRAIRAEAEGAMLPRAPGPILGSDRDAGAIAAAEANAVRAGVSGDVSFRRCAISGMELPIDVSGWIVTNPPYGVRVGERQQLRNLYAQLGNVARRRCPGWRLALLSGDRALETQVGLPLVPVWASRNGGLPVRLVEGPVVLLAGERRAD